MGNRQKAVMDADLLQLICRNDGAEDFFVRFFQKLDYDPIVSWYVANAELLTNNNITNLINGGQIHVVHPKDFLKNKSQKRLFAQNVRSVANMINQKPIPVGVDILDESFHLAGGNLGELISEMMAKELNIQYFASNDKGAKKYAKLYINTDCFTLQVLNIADLLEMLGKKKDHGFSWKHEIKPLLFDSRWDNVREKIRKYWVYDN